MKVFIFLVSSLLLGFSSAAPEPEDGVYSSIPDMINATIQALLDSLPEPIVAEAVDLTIPAASLNGTLQLRNLTASGLKALKVPYLNLTMIGMRLYMTIQLDALRVKADYYDANLVLIDLLPVYGKGSADIQLGGVSITLSTQTDLHDGLQLKNLWIQIGLGSAYFDITGLYYDDGVTEAINSFLNDDLVNFLNNFPGVARTVLSPIVQDLINSLLAGDTSLAEAFRKEISQETYDNNYD